MRGRKLHALPGELQRGLDQPPPGQAPVRFPESHEAGRQPGDAAGGRADRVVHQLGTERHLEVEQLRFTRLRAQARDGDETVEVAGAPGGGVEVDRVSAAEQTGHDGFRDA